MCSFLHLYLHSIKPDPRTTTARPFRVATSCVFPWVSDEPYGTYLERFLSRIVEGRWLFRGRLLLVLIADVAAHFPKTMLPIESITPSKIHAKKMTNPFLGAIAEEEPCEAETTTPTKPRHVPRYRVRPAWALACIEE